jgi:hypothetical protein
MYTPLHLMNLSEHCTTHYLSKPDNLIFPYSLSLFFALGFISIGICSPMQNEMLAIDGGFLQVSTTTAGRTEIKGLIELN